MMEDVYGAHLRMECVDRHEGEGCKRTCSNIDRNPDVEGVLGEERIWDCEPDVK